MLVPPAEVVAGDAPHRGGQPVDCRAQCWVDQIAAPDQHLSRRPTLGRLLDGHHGSTPSLVSDFDVFEGAERVGDEDSVE
ncbi:MAG: hypothetical protein ACRDZO_08935 [Egibacteraceae bacterium]